MEETITKEKKKPGPLNYKNEGLKIKIKGNYNQKSLRIDYFD